METKKKAAKAEVKTEKAAEKAAPAKAEAKTEAKAAPKAAPQKAEAKAVITKDTLISEVLKIDENLAEVFFEFGMHCLGCPISNGESIGEASMAHGIDADELLKALNAKAGK